MEESDYSVLHDGVPDWLQATLWRWLADRAAEGGHSMIRQLERQLRQSFTEARDRPVGHPHTPALNVLERFWRTRTDADRLSLLDAILYYLQGRAEDEFDNGHISVGQRITDAAEMLGAHLVEGGSLWTTHVDEPQWGLKRRVEEPITDLLAKATSQTSDASRSLRAAWHACYRHDPDPDKAYADAVKAVEAVVLPETIPSDSRGTLGKAISHLRATPSRWNVGGMDSKQSTSTLLAMLETLWSNQERHAHHDGKIMNVTQSEAEAAVGLSALVVHWFTSGLVTKI